MKNPISMQAQRVQEFILGFQACTMVLRQHPQRLTRIKFRLAQHLFHHERCFVFRLQLLQAVVGVSRWRWNGDPSIPILCNWDEGCDLLECKPLLLKPFRD